VNVLFLSQRIPEPPNKGDKIRSHHFMRRLATRHRVHLASLLDDESERVHVEPARAWAESVTVRVRSPSESAWRGAWSPVTGRPISLGYFHSEALASDVTSLLERERFDVVVAYCSSMAPYAARFAGPKVVDFVDADSEKWAEYARRSRFPKSAVYALENRLLRTYEGKLVRDFDRGIIISAEERDVLAAFADVSRVDVVSNGVDTQWWDRGESSPPRASTPPVLVFVGALDYFANADGIESFARDVFPRLRNVAPGLELRIVGRRPGSAVRALDALPGVVVVGEVDDVRPELWGATAAVVPLRIAQGLQNKVLEAMAAGTPVVSTAAAIRGIEGEAGRHFLRADALGEWIAHVRSLIADPARAAQQADEALRLVRERYSWDRKAEEYEAVLERAVRDASSGVSACETR
jgi:sugar transferase (PEP-CTERM/EpsH1 system associated)